ncbi:ABC transporter permease [Spirochaeta africana]|uniref:ABC-type transport system, involved in lipoprotein release, permease component n=1 Tax=Spirochaeta africana (strain ATCC 700263 / DSM 8902 / Z-7692) TaxID=889378 RepID=H9UI04_SPIAZ|nr:ABC transporter permease [Spirochaeta africana]AFG37147.1 ABC-type transport system, involved in lipoprotein release, permease component [Spirochaeta africana DSM 8902]
MARFYEPAASAGSLRRRWLWWVAIRYLRSKRKEKSNIATLLSVSGIAVGVAALIVVLGVMNGFQFSTISNILELSSYHLRVGSEDGFTYAEADDWSRRLLELPGVASAVPFTEVQTLVQGPLREPVGIQVRGIPDDLRSRDPGMAAKLRMQSGRLQPHDQQIVIGTELARRLGSRVGDTINLIHFEGRGVLQPRERAYQVAGLFATDFYEFDQNYVFVHVEQAVEHLGAPGLQIGVKLDDRFQDRSAATRIAALMQPETDQSLRIQRWRDFDRSIFGALQLEKSLMTMLLGLVFLVVGVNIFQSLRRSVIERTDELGVLKAMGAGPRSVQLIFVLEGAIIGLAGAAIGTAAGLLLSRYLNETVVLVRRVLGQGTVSPALWSNIPVALVPAEVAATAAVAIVSTVLAGYAASRRVAGILPAEVLRDE